MAAILLRYLDEKSITQGRRDTAFRELRNGAGFARDKQHRLKEILETPVVTTPHVLAEVFRFRETSMLHNQRAELRSCCFDLLSTGEMVEVPCPASELYRDPRFRDLACRFALTDAGLIFIASRMNAVLLTDDKRLFTGARFGLSFQIRLLEDYLSA